MKNILYIERPKGTCRHYRVKSELERFWGRIKDLSIEYPEKYKDMLRKGIRLNSEAKDLLRIGKVPDLKEAVSFLTKLAIFGTVLPYIGGNYEVEDAQIIRLIKELRRASYYPRVMGELVVPAAQKELRKMGIKDADAIKLITIKEIMAKRKGVFGRRLRDYKDGKTYIYYASNGKERVEFVSDPSPLVSTIDKDFKGIDKGLTKITGKQVFGGIARGKVKIISTNIVTKADSQRFHKGDILVAIYTNPNLLPILKKSGAIVTDEGGITSHAAIMARELKKPTIIGTKIATKVLKEGDFVEVDANHGTVRVIKRK